MQTSIQQGYLSLWRGRLISSTSVKRINRRAERFGNFDRLCRSTLINTVYKLYPPVCLACGANDQITLDHVIPLSKGGRNHWRNLQPLCLGCNQRKADRVVDYRM